MAHKENILKILAAESGPITMLELGKKLGLPTTSFTTQVNRLKLAGQVEVDENKEYFITDHGREALEAEGEDLPPADILQRSENPEAVTSQYQKFIKLGLQAGVINKGLIKATADHVWNGGEYTDLLWVRQALKEADIQPDLANRWTAFWRTYLKQPVTAELASAMRSEPAAKDKDGKPLEKGTRSHILDSDDKPLFVGEGLGDLDYRDAVHLSEVRAAARARGGVGNGHGQPQTMGDLAEQLVKVVAAVDTFRGQQAPGRNFVVKPKADGTGGFEVAEVVPGEPMVIPEPKLPQAAKSYFVNPQTQKVEEVETGKPVFITLTQPPPIAQAASNVVRYLVDKASGQVTPITGNEPIIIQAAAPQNPYVPLQLDKDGKPIAPPNLDTWLRLEDWKIDQQRKQEKHDVAIELSKGLKDLLKNAAEVAQKMAQKKA